MKTRCGSPVPHLGYNYNINVYAIANKEEAIARNIGTIIFSP